jgi:hypothetical protein
MFRWYSEVGQRSYLPNAAGVGILMGQFWIGTRPDDLEAILNCSLACDLTIWSNTGLSGHAVWLIYAYKIGYT